MSDDYSNEDFDSLFQRVGVDGSGSGLTAAQVRQVEKIASEQLVRGYQALQQGVAVVQQMTAEAIRKTEEAHPGFIARYSDPQVCRKFIEQRPAVARAILNAESGTGTESLPELLDIFDETTRNWPGNRSTEPSRESSAPASILSLQQINRLPVEQRREHIEALGDRVADMSIDEADPANEAFKIERGE